MDNVRLLDLRTRAQQLSNTVGDGNVTTAEWNALANRHAKRVYGLLVDAGPADYYAASTSVVTTDGIAPNVLPDDFLNLTGVYVIETTGRRRPIDPMREGTLGNYKSPIGEWTILLEYVPTMPPMVDDADTFDAVSGYDELIVNLMARDVMIKRDTAETAEVRQTIAEEQARITSKARKRDRGPKRTVDLDERDNDWFPYLDASGSRISCYRLRAGNLELYQPFWNYP